MRYWFTGLYVYKRCYHDLAPYRVFDPSLYPDTEQCAKNARILLIAGVPRGWCWVTDRVEVW